METIEKRLRIYYSKFGFIRFTSNLDVQRIWERTLRRAGIKIAYSHGFHPQAKIQQASPLPLGFESSAEIVDIWISADSDTKITEEDLNHYLPEGLSISYLEFIDPGNSSLQPLLFSSDYEIHFFDKKSLEELECIRQQVINSSTIIFTKHNGKQYDLKPLILNMEIHSHPQNGDYLSMKLSSQINSTGRPDHVLMYFQIDPAQTRIIRTQIDFIKQ
ncbi:MAG TPA: hypothetical protein DCK95_03310 [Anaerolineaceae bacterium]|uniref:DUF2344 domain-containing protein n=1 Tax=Anaerolinea thermophila TaxID=167964 RepID=A0A117LH09_9CHLR|nr:MAG: hypothetical protein XD73_0460 [Anaerolinea thermophila]HAF61337.1 hypothetical protein [Anaerolineaceae bacterium]